MSLPTLLADFVAFHDTRPHGELGYVELGARSLPSVWIETYPRLADHAEVFGTLPDGSLLVLARTDEGEKLILLGSEGALDTLGESPADFLWRWSRGDTGEAFDLNEGSLSEIAAWLVARGVNEPAAPTVAFDVIAWLEGASSTSALPSSADTSEVPQLEALEPFLRELANAVGRRADDARVVSLFASLGRSVPASLAESKWVEAPKRGLQLLFVPELLHVDHPPVPKTNSSFVPFLSLAHFDAKTTETVLGVALDASAESLDAELGARVAVAATARNDGRTVSVWRVPLGRDVELVARGATKRQWSIVIRQARSLSALSVPTRVVLAWAATRGLLDPTATEADALGRLATRRSDPSAVTALYPRGLWDAHLREPLRDFAHGWFHRIGPVWIRTDFEAVFGSRPGPHGHAMPDLDDDGWESVDRVAGVLEERFAAFV